MQRNTLHTALRIVTLVVMLLTSTGFTAVVKYCTMTESSACCCEESHETATRSTDGATLSSPDASCFVQTVAGGRNEIAATMHAAEQLVLPVLEVLPVESDAAAVVTTLRASALFQTDDAAPPGVDIYIRVNSFLI